MKHFVYILCTAALLSGCKKDEISSDISSGKAVLFNVMLDGMEVSETRAADTDTDLKTHGFYLAGYHTEGQMATVAATAYPNVFNHDVQDAQAPVPLVRYTDSKFTLKTIKWSLDETTYLSFFSWSQSKPIPTSGVTSATTGIFAFAKESTDKGYPWFDIRNANTPLTQSDVVGSRSLNNHNDAVISAVDLNFQHLLSKLTFKAKSSSNANIVFTAVNIKYAASKVYKKARFTFGSDAATLGAYGSFAEYHAGTAALNAIYPTIMNGAEVVLGYGLLIPQALLMGDVSLEVKYKLSPNSGSVPGIEQTKTLPLSAFTFAQGKNYSYTIDVQATGILVMADPVIEPWILSGTSLPVVPGPKGNTLLLLDGYDRPYQHSDGKWYWLDRSGYNRHVLLNNMTAANYSASKKCYTFSASNSGSIPNLGTVSDLSVEICAERSTLNAQTEPMVLKSSAGNRSFGIFQGLSSTGWIYVDTGGNAVSGQGRLAYAYPGGESAILPLAVWGYVSSNSPNKQVLYRNGLLLHQQNMSLANRLSAGGALSNNVLGGDYAGNIHYVKIKSNPISLGNAAYTYRMAGQRYNVPEGAQIMPPVSDALAIWLDGYNMPQTINGKLVWKDSGKAQNHAELMTDQVVWASDGSYVFKNNGYMQLIKTLTASGVMANNSSLITIELVFVPDNGHASPSEGLLRICDNLDAAPGEQIWKGNFAGIGYQGQSEYGNNARWRVLLDNVEVPAGVTHSFVWANGRTTSNNNAYLDGKKYVGKGGVSGGIQWCVIGYACPPNSPSRNYFSGKIKAVRIHTRILTDAQIAANYEFDKGYYNMDAD